MTPLGKPLVFYLKYMAEMNHLCSPEYYGGEPDLNALENPEQIREMARIVGDVACEQVADFLELCGRKIEEHFNGLGIAKLEKKKSRAYMLGYWEWGARVYVSSLPRDWFWCGVDVSAPPEIQVSMDNDACGVVWPIIWSKGGRKGADAVWDILGGWPHSRSGEGLVKEKGSVALACIPIKAQPPDSFDVDRDQLIAAVMKTIARIGAEETEAIVKFVASLKGSEEDGVEHEKEEGEENAN